MGKTIQMISLLLAEPGRPNLIVAPTVAIVQWRNEIQEHAPSLKVLIFHGSNRTESMSELMKQDVVLTTCKPILALSCEAVALPGVIIQTICFTDMFLFLSPLIYFLKTQLLRPAIVSKSTV